MTNTVTEVAPQHAWDGLRTTDDAVLVDVRTQAEWSFVGTPDLSELGKETILLEWLTLPGMQPNPGFTDQLLTHFDGSAPSRVYFLCRSGARSLHAAHAMAEAFDARGQAVACINVAEGFEGDLDGHGHRGKKNGWKVAKLAWRQS